MTFIIGTPHTHNAGYFRNDDRPSGGQLAQADIQTCTHCQAVIKMQNWKSDGAWCSKCEAPICGSENPECAGRTAQFGCVPFLKQIELHAAKLMRYQHFSKIAGLDAPAPPRSQLITGSP